METMRYALVRRRCFSLSMDVLFPDSQHCFRVPTANILRPIVVGYTTHHGGLYNSLPWVVRPTIVGRRIYACERGNMWWMQSEKTHYKTCLLTNKADCAGAVRPTAGKRKQKEPPLCPLRTEKPVLAKPECLNSLRSNNRPSVGFYRPIFRLTGQGGKNVPYVEPLSLKNQLRN